MYVDPDHRGTDVADALMEAALSVAREQSLPMDRIVLDVDRANERARAFYDRWGFEHWGEMVVRDRLPRSPKMSGRLPICPGPAVKGHDGPYQKGSKTTSGAVAR